MNIKINQENEIVNNSENYIELNYNENRLLIFGNFITLFQNKRFLSKNESIEILKISLNSINHLEKNIRDTIGSCQFILIKKNGFIRIFNSNESPGLFYGIKHDSLYVSTEEIDVSKKLIQNDFNDFELIDYLFKHYKKRNSFNSVIEEVRRLPTSFSLNIEKNFNLSKSCFANLKDFCTDTRSFKDLDSDFKYHLEETINFYYKKSKGSKVYSDLSGGIDSSVITIACKKKNIDITALHHTKDDWITNVASSLLKIINLPVKFIFGDYKKSEELWWSEYKLLNNDESMEKNLGMYPLDSTQCTDLFRKNDLIKFGGACMGQNYQIYPCVYPVFGMLPFVRFILDLKKAFFIRFINTKIFISLLSLPFFSVIIEKIFLTKGTLPKNQKEYLFYISMNGVNFSMPDIDKDIKSISPLFYKEYINYFSDLYLKNFLEKSDYTKITSNKQIKPEKLQQYARLISHNRSVFNDKFLTDKVAKGCNIIEPAFISSFSNFLLKLNVGVREIFFPKGLFFRYFKNELKIDYFKDFIPKTYRFKNIYIHILLMPFRLIKRLIRPKKKSEYNTYSQGILCSKKFKENYHQFLDVENSRIIQKIKNQSLKKIIIKKIKDIKKGNTPLYLACNFVNLEIFLRKAWDKK